MERLRSGAGRGKTSRYLLCRSVVILLNEVKGPEGTATQESPF